MQSVRSRIWTRVAVSISCDDNHYTIWLDAKPFIIIIIIIIIINSLVWELFTSALAGRYYLPTPPLGQDMTQGQFLSGV